MLLFLFKVILVEGPSGDLIPKMKQQHGIKSFDFVFLDHWKDRYVPDTKLLEVKPKTQILFTLTQVMFLTQDTFSKIAGVWFTQKRLCPFG